MGQDHVLTHRQLPRSMQRTCEFAVAFRPDQLALLEQLRKRWQLRSVRTVAWAIITSQLEQSRRRWPDLGVDGIALALGLRTLRMKLKDLDASAADG